jgi:hypothetical protein
LSFLKNNKYRQVKKGPIVQWTEYQIPVLTIWVRLPVGSQLTKNLT